MNKSIYVKDINTLLKQYRPGRFEPEYHEWTQNSDILLILAILRDNPNPELRKVSIDRIDALFENRWQEIAGSAACYLGDKPQTATNKFFIALAQHLAKLFPERYSHYYKLLMSTATNLDKEFATTLTPVIETPLEDLFLGDDQALVCISDTLEYAEKYFHLTKVETKTYPALTLAEKEQLLRDKKARTVTLDFIHPPKEKQVGSLSYATAHQLRLLGMACLHGKCDFSTQAIGNFYLYLKDISPAEKARLDAYDIPGWPTFGDLWSGFVNDGVCIYYAGNYFCIIAFDFIREDAQWDPFLPYMPHHEEAAFIKPVRDQLKQRRPLKICRDKFEKMDVAALRAEVSVDENQARAELLIIKNYIEQKSWNTLGIKTTTIVLPNQNIHTIPSSFKPVYVALVKDTNIPIDVLLSIKERFKQRYFAEASCKNPELLAFYRSFYTNNYITYMQESLHPPEQQLDLDTVPVMEMK